MLGSSVLEVVIGVVFVYLVLSMICTTLNEAIATVVNQRATTLFEGIKNLLNDPSFTGLAQQIYNHGLVDGISRNAADPAKPTRLPSYMPAKNFALALLDLLGTHGVVAAAQGDLLTQAEKAFDAYHAEAAKATPDQAALQRTKQDADKSKQDLDAAAAGAKAAYDQALQAPAPNPAAVAKAKSAADAAGAAVKMLAAREAAVASARDPKNAAALKQASDTLEAALSAGRALAAGLPDQLANFQAAVQRLPDGHTKEALAVLIEKAKHEATGVGEQVVRFREEVEGWFNDAMDRVGGWYKRWTQQILLILALVLVVSLNADTVLLVQRFSTDKDLRASIVKEATDTTTLDQVRKEMNSVGLPLGWSRDPRDDRRFPWIASGRDDAVDTIGAWLKKLLGLLLTIAAISLGAPFWFDTLSKLVNLRGAGTPPGEKKKSAPK